MCIAAVEQTKIATPVASWSSVRRRSTPQRRPFPPLPSGPAPVVSLPETVMRAAADSTNSLDGRSITLTGFTLPKLLWVREHEPDAWKQVRALLLPKDYVRFRLTGDRATDVADALVRSPTQVGAGEIGEVLNLLENWLGCCPAGR